MHVAAPSLQLMCVFLHVYPMTTEWKNFISPMRDSYCIIIIIIIIIKPSVTERDETPHCPLQNVLDSASPAPFPHLAQVFHRGHQGMKIGAQCCLSQIGQLELILFFIF